MPLNHTAALFAIATPHFERLVDFYKALLTQEPTVYTPNVYAEFQLPGVKLGIYRPKVEFGVTPTLREAKATETLRERSLEFGVEALDSKLSTLDPALSPRTSLCLEVVNLAAAIAHMTELGYPPIGAILTASHGREIYAYDPDGNRLILHQGFDQPLEYL